jgi:hypothetical protein
MNSILKYGIYQVNFNEIGDFGAGFYCADKVRTALRFAMVSALDREGVGRHSASIIYFDVNNDDVNELDQVELEGDEWTQFTGRCLEEGDDDLYKDRDDLQLVKGKFVHNPHEVQLKRVTSEEFEDERMQYAFRHQAGDLLLANKENMGVALFDVYMPDFDVSMPGFVDEENEA